MIGEKAWEYSLWEGLSGPIHLGLLRQERNKLEDMSAMIFSRRLSPWVVAGLLFFSGIGRAQTPPLPPPAVIKPVVNRDYLPVALNLINEAKKTVDFIQLEFHYDPTVMRIQEALQAAAARGVSVRGLLEDSVSFNRRSQTYLEKSGIDAVLDTPEKMTHAKLFIADGEKVLLGSTNLSGNSIDNNNETNVYVEDKRLGAYFEKYFEALREDSLAEPKVGALVLPAIATVVNRQYYPEVSKLLSGAKTRIWVVMYGTRYYQGSEVSLVNKLLDALVAARKRGVEVKVLMDWSDYNQTLNAINAETKKRLEKDGIDVRYDRADVTTHAKLVVVDERAVVGSVNWGYDALERRNEASLIISDTAAVKYYADYFLRLWGESTPGAPATAPSPAAPVPVAPAAPGAAPDIEIDDRG